MTWYEAVVMVILDVLLLWIGFKLGQREGQRKNQAREEAIRLNAYSAGKENMADFYRTLVNRTTEQHDTKESS